MKPVFIYALSDPDGKIRYVGQTPTPDSRLSAHTSGFVGAYKHKASGKWQASFQIRKIQNYVGIFVKIEDAVFARALAIANQDLTPAGL